jgi:hypothetical protein
MSIAIRWPSLGSLIRDLRLFVGGTLELSEAGEKAAEVSKSTKMALTMTSAVVSHFDRFFILFCDDDIILLLYRLLLSTFTVKK